MISFLLQKLLSFIRSYLSVFARVSIALGSLCGFITYSSQNKISTAFPTYRLQIHIPSN